MLSSLAGSDHADGRAAGTRAQITAFVRSPTRQDGESDLEDFLDGT